MNLGNQYCRVTDEYAYINYQNVISVSNNIFTTLRKFSNSFTTRGPGWLNELGSWIT
jgi:hypothetical protein